MNATEQPHYAPASVGVLIEPAFLRGVVGDAYGDRVRGGSRKRLTMRLRAAIDAIVGAWRRTAR